MALRFLLDEHISPLVARMAARKGLDVRAIAGSALAGRTDRTVFRAAIEHDQVVVTYNIRDFAILYSTFLRGGAPIKGVIFVDSRTIPASDSKALTRALVRLAARIRRGEVNVSGCIFLNRD